MDLPSNAHNVLGPSPKQQKKPEKVVEKVVTGEVIQRKKSLGKQFKTTFFGGEFKGASRYVVMDVIIPAVKNVIVDATTKGIERMIYGETLNPRSRPGMTGPKFSYNRPVERYSNHRPLSRPGMLPDQPPLLRRSSRESFSETILDSRIEAETVMERLGEFIENYDFATVADFNELIGMPQSNTDEKWGWTSLRGAEVRQVRDGYLIDLPNPEPIN